MTDKELRKLSRLELLEILLEETRENEKLKEELKEAGEATKSNRMLLSLIDKLNYTLSQADKMTAKLREASENIATAEPAGQAFDVPKNNSLRENTVVAKAGRQNKEIDKSLIMSDLKLYLRILNYYLANETALNALPSDIQKDIRTRTRGILNAKKSKTPD